MIRVIQLIIYIIGIKIYVCIIYTYSIFITFIRYSIFLFSTSSAKPFLIWELGFNWKCSSLRFSWMGQEFVFWSQRMHPSNVPSRCFFHLWPSILCFQHVRSFSQYCSLFSWNYAYKENITHENEFYAYSIVRVMSYFYCIIKVIVELPCNPIKNIIGSSVNNLYPTEWKSLGKLGKWILMNCLFESPPSLRE